MLYDEAVDYLYARLPMFTRDGASAFKKDLTNTLRLCEALGNPQERLKAIHIAGTNGKGSTSHMLAAILQTAGYRTGLYTSPHLLDFRERIRVDGKMISKRSVSHFVGKYRELIETIQPSFFEVTVALAFDHFAKKGIDVAVIETGLGGRLDSTNVITPVLSIITNIGYDHMNMLGNTLQEIANEKGGIIKPGIPVIVGEWQPEVAGIFERIARENSSKLIFASQQWYMDTSGRNGGHLYLVATSRQTGEKITYALDLTGSYQAKNLPAILCAITQLQEAGFSIRTGHVQHALGQVTRLTGGPLGRWQTLSTHPTVVCDTGHNVDGWREVLANIANTPHRRLHMVVGVMGDKDLGTMLPLLPKGAYYYFCQVAMPRALPVLELLEAGKRLGLQGTDFPTVGKALNAALAAADSEDLVFAGGSTFVVGEVLANL